MNVQFLQDRFDRIFDHALVFHGFADHMRDYDLIAFCTTDSQSGIEPETIRIRFRNCVYANVESVIDASVWARSLDERLVDYETGRELEGFVWV